MLAAGEGAVEARSVTAASAFISDHYQDEAGRDRRGIQRLLAGYFLTHQAIHLLVQIDHLGLIDDSRAEVTLLSAVAGRPGTTLEQLLTLRADLIRLDLELAKEAGEWRITSSRWRRASQQDFLQ